MSYLFLVPLIIYLALMLALAVHNSSESAVLARARSGFAAFILWFDTRIANFNHIVALVRQKGLTVPAAIIALLSSKTVRYIGLALALLLSAWLYYAHVYHKGFVAGRDAALAAVVEQNRKAESTAAAANTDVSKCTYAGGHWDVSTGKCSQ